MNSRFPFLVRCLTTDSTAYLYINVYVVLRFLAVVAADVLVDDIFHPNPSS